MNILMLSKFFYPHIGGVEKHVFEISKRLVQKGHKATILTEKYNSELKINEKYKGINIHRITYPKIKIIGLVAIWLRLLKQVNLIRNADIVHCHDVFIWYLPFRVLFPRKKVFITHHGGQAVYPVSKKAILLKRLASALSKGTICIGKFIPKYFGVSYDAISYGAVDIPEPKKKENRIVYLGRLDKDTGILAALNELKGLKGYKIDFCGDGSLRKKCEKVGKVHGFVDPVPFLSKAMICCPVGYLSAIEGMANKCRLRVFWDNDLKRDYWTETPFYKFIKDNDVKGAYNWAKKQTWEKLLKTYLKLWEAEK